MCDTNRNNNCVTNSDGVPDLMPAWLKCPPSLKERSYPIPDGVSITPISQGGRNGSSKKQFKCGQCGQDARPKPDAKPNAPPDCPMMKARNCPGAADKNESKGGSMLEKIKNFLGIGKEDLRLVEACKRLNVTDDHIRHHQEVFDIALLCGKDGYFAPLFTKVDCQNQQDDECTCRTDDVNGEEADYEDENCEEDVEEEEEEDEEYCEEDDASEAEDEAGMENMICMCTCHTEDLESDKSKSETKSNIREEECVEDLEGECVLEESAECMDPECKFFFEEQDEKKRKKDDFSQVGNSSEQDCIAMNNFIIRVQAPFSETTTNDTCEQILERLTKKKPAYPEPGPRSEKVKHDEPPPCREIELVVRQISVEEPTCECPPKPQQCKSDTPLPPPSIDNCEERVPTPQIEVGSAAAQSTPKVEPECECCSSLLQPVTEDASGGTLPSSSNPPVLRPQNDCEVLSEEELLKKPIKYIKCGCPKSPCSSGGADWPEGTSVWIPPPPPPCPRCGVAERGGTEDCYLCHITRRMRSGLPEIRETPKSFAVELPKLIEKPTDLCTPEYLEDGSIKYKGGMCMSLANSYIWHLAKRIPPGGLFDRFTGECGEEARLQAITGTNSFAEAMSACNCANSKESAYKGGMSLENCQRYLWGEKLIDEIEEQEEATRKCQKPPPTKSSLPSPDQCPAPRE